MSFMSNEELKAKGYNRKQRRSILGINKKAMGVEETARHHPIPSFRQHAVNVIRGTYV